MNSTMLFPSPIKDGRRILGEKSTNACLSPAANRVVDVNVTPVKRRALFETGSSPKKLLPSPEFTSRKRSIAQVEEIQTDNGTARAQRDAPLQLLESNSSQSTIVDSDMLDGAIDPDTRGHAEQVQSRPNGRSLDLPPRNTIPDDPESRKAFVQQKAALLRTRIQSAMRNVKNNELDRRLSALEAHSRKCQRLSSASTHQRKSSQCQPPLLTHTPQAPPLHPAALGATDFPMPEPGLSSPSLSFDNANQDDHMRTPTQNDYPGAAKSPMQLGTPLVSVAGPVRNAGEADGAAKETTSTPPRKVDAIDGLLKLMNTADR